mmetsp:Transcript_13200/g.23347  ORF Transcript_13200/g.23347 Transcript_13200/m.23347 type:complete len:439 (-) Transcript_13200:117-1433(-)
MAFLEAEEPTKSPPHHRSLNRTRPPTLNLRSTNLQEQRVEEGDATLTSWSSLQDTFDIEDVLGRGTAAVVHRARRRQSGEIVALKSSYGCNEPEVRSFAHGEFDLIRSLDHRCIVRAYDIFDLQSSVCICLEYCADGSIDSHVDSHGPFVEKAAVPLALELVEAVHYLHAKRIVHRDIKPANILLTANASSLKITDFNSARKIGQTFGGNAMLTERCTDMFKAPEMVFQKIWGERIDVWAIGLSLFFMTEAALPFVMRERANKACLEAGALPKFTWKANMSDLWKNLILLCLTVDSALRPPAIQLLEHPILKPSMETTVGKPSPTNSEDKLPAMSSSGYNVQDWKEGRDGQETLRKVAENTCARSMVRQSFLSQVSAGSDASTSVSECLGSSKSTSASESFRPRRRHVDGHKFFTTHGGVHFADDVGSPTSSSSSPDA